MKIIESLSVDRSDLRIRFLDGGAIVLTDNGQSCCEERYMTCDDSLDYYVGASYYGWEVRNCPDGGDSEYDIHEIQFLLVNTSRGTFTVANHNIHNGYYGGFAITQHDTN